MRAPWTPEEALDRGLCAGSDQPGAPYPGSRLVCPACRRISSQTALGRVRPHKPRKLGTRPEVLPPSVSEVQAARGDQVFLHLQHAREHVGNAIRHHLDDQPDMRDKHIVDAMADLRWTRRCVTLAREVQLAEETGM